MASSAAVFGLHPTLSVKRHLRSSSPPSLVHYYSPFAASPNFVFAQGSSPFFSAKPPAFLRSPRNPLPQAAAAIKDRVREEEERSRFAMKERWWPELTSNWWDDISDSTHSQDAIFFALCGAYALVSLIALVQLIRIQLRVPEFGWTTQKVFHLMNFIVNGVCAVVFGFHMFAFARTLLSLGQLM